MNTITAKHALRKVLSRDWVVFVVVSVLLVGLVVETALIKVSGFWGISDAYMDVKVFSALAIFCIISQVILLNFVHMKISNFVSLNKSFVRILHKAMLLTQLGIIVLLGLILVEVIVTFRYHLVLLEVVFLISFLSASCMMALLSSRFIIWLKSNRNRLTFTYMFASSCLSLSAIIGIVYVLVQLSDTSVPDIVRPKLFGEFVMHSNIGNPLLASIYTIFSVITFALLWVGTVFLLQSYRKRIGTIKYWIIMSIPLVYFLSQFEPLIFNALFSGSLDNPILFGILYIIIVVASRPLGGILFGLSFMQVARKLQHPEVKSYMTISAIGLLLLLMSYQAQVLITAPFPPFGLLSVSFMGLSSYLTFIGIYSSAVSVSQDSRLRSSIRKSVETEVNFIGNIGSAQMDHMIMEKVLTTERNISEKLREKTGIAPSLTEKEIVEYIEIVLQEMRKDVK